MKFGYVESQKTTRDEYSLVSGMTEAGINLDHAALHFYTKQLLTL